MCLVLSPARYQSLSDEEEHDRNLGNREETPNAGLFHQIWRDQAGEIRTEDEKENPLDDHSSLFIQREERRKHAEAVNGSTRDEICRICLQIA